MKKSGVYGVRVRLVNVDSPWLGVFAELPDSRSIREAIESDDCDCVKQLSAAISLVDRYNVDVVEDITFGDTKVGDILVSGTSLYGTGEPRKRKPRSDAGKPRGRRSKAKPEAEGKSNFDQPQTSEPQVA